MSVSAAEYGGGGLSFDADEKDLEEVGRYGAGSKEDDLRGLDVEDEACGLEDLLPIFALTSC